MQTETHQLLGGDYGSLKDSSYNYKNEVLVRRSNCLLNKNVSKVVLAVVVDDLPYISGNVWVSWD